jgi:hypothetical protein
LTQTFFSQEQDKKLEAQNQNCISEEQEKKPEPQKPV